MSRWPRAAGHVWGDQLPFTLLAATDGVTVNEGTPLEVTHVGPDRYEAAFTPDAVGEWRLAFVSGDATNGYYELDHLRRTFAVQ